METIVSPCSGSSRRLLVTVQTWPLAASVSSDGLPRKRTCPCASTAMSRQVCADVLDDVGGEDHRPVARGEADQQIAEADALFGVEARGGLVDDEDLGIVDQRLRDPHPPFHAAGETLDLPVGGILQRRPSPAPPRRAERAGAARPIP